MENTKGTDKLLELIRSLDELVGEALGDIEEQTGFRFIKNDDMKDGTLKDFETGSLRLLDTGKYDYNYAQAARKAVFMLIVEKALGDRFTMNNDSCVLFNKKTGDILIDLIPYKMDSEGTVASAVLDRDEGEVAYEDAYTLKTHGAAMRAIYPLTRLCLQGADTANELWDILTGESGYRLNNKTMSHYYEGNRLLDEMRDTFLRIRKGEKA